MATNTLNMRIMSKGDTYQNWFDANPTPLKNEICVVSVPADANAVVQEPAILFKVGDGTSDFKTLAFTSAIAADVYDWAKAATKPEYTAEEIDGLADYISGKIQDTDTQYKLVKVDNYNYKLQAKDIDGEWADVEDSTIVIPEFDDSALEASIGANTTAIATLNGTGTGSVSKAITDAIAALALSTTYEAKGAAATVQSDLDAYKLSNNTAVGAAQDAADAAQDAADAAQEDVDALVAKVGTVTEGKTVVEMIEDAETAATYDDTALAGRVTVVEGGVAANTAAITTLNGSGEGSVTKAVNDAVTSIIAGADASYDTLKEIADWIASDTTGAAKMQSDIVTNASAIDALETLVGDTAVATQIANAITALGIADYATVEDMEALEGRVETLEGDSHTHANATVLDGITAAKVTAWDAAEQNAKDYTDELEGELSAVAKSGDVIDLVQTEGDYLIFNCGSATTVI